MAGLHQVRLGSSRLRRVASVNSTSPRRAWHSIGARPRLRLFAIAQFRAPHEAIIGNVR
jgi:hypothetical protein